MQRTTSGILAALAAATLAACSNSGSDDPATLGEALPQTLTPLGPETDADAADEPTPAERRQAWVEARLMDKSAEVGPGSTATPTHSK